MIKEFPGENSGVVEQRQEGVFSNHSLLDAVLREVESNLPLASEEKVGSFKTPYLIGLPTRYRSDVQEILGIIQGTRQHKVFKKGACGMSRYGSFGREKILLVRSTVEFWAQGVAWDNMPSVLYRFISNESLRELINNPKVAYAENKNRTNSMLDKRRWEFSKLLLSELLPTNSFDLTQENIAPYLPGDFLADEESWPAKRTPDDREDGFKKHPRKVDDQDQIEKRDLSLEDLLRLYEFLTINPTKPPQVDSMSAVRLAEVGLTIMDADVILERFDRMTGGLRGATDSTDQDFYTLANATRVLLQNSCGIDLKEGEVGFGSK